VGNVRRNVTIDADSGEARNFFTRGPNTNNFFNQGKIIYFKILYIKFKG
jgi:hypothetical protein